MSDRLDHFVSVIADFPWDASWIEEPCAAGDGRSELNRRLAVFRLHCADQSKRLCEAEPRPGQHSDFPSTRTAQGKGAGDAGGTTLVLLVTEAALHWRSCGKATRPLEIHVSLFAPWFRAGRALTSVALLAKHDAPAATRLCPQDD